MYYLRSKSAVDAIKVRINALFFVFFVVFFVLFFRFIVNKFWQTSKKNNKKKVRYKKVKKY